MAEEPMLGLFDGDTNFLDELAGPSATDLGITGLVGSSASSNLSGMPQTVQQGGTQGE